MPEMKGRWVAPCYDQGLETNTETRCRTLEEIDELFANKVSVWKFKSYETTIRAEAAHEVEEKVYEKEVSTKTKERAHNE
jgi:hypothetical protein